VDPDRWSHHWRSGGPMPLALTTLKWSHEAGGRQRARRGARITPQARQCTTAWPPSASSTSEAAPRQPSTPPASACSTPVNPPHAGSPRTPRRARRLDQPCIPAATVLELHLVWVARLILPRPTAVMPGCPWPTQAATLSAARCIGPPSVQRVQRAIPERAPVALAGASLMCRSRTVLTSSQIYVSRAG
jgi:hypothetical protein